MKIDNLILIEGGAYKDIKKALKQWIHSYSDALEPDFTFELHKNGRGNHIIKVDDRLGNDYFYFLINYLSCPEGIEFEIEIEGFTRGKDENVLKNKSLLVYISPNDEEYDNVFVATAENENYKIDFGGKITQQSEGRSFQYPIGIQLEAPEVFRTNRALKSQENEEKTRYRIDKRFRIILIILGLLWLVHLYISFFVHESDLYQKASWFLFVGMGVWFLLEDEMLTSPNYYVKCLFIAFCVLGYGYLLVNYLRPDLSGIAMTPFLYPLALLIIQWPTRRLYKAIFKREPKIDQHGKLADGIYTLIVVLGTTTLPFLISYLIS